MKDLLLQGRRGNGLGKDEEAEKDQDLIMSSWQRKSTVTTRCQNTFAVATREYVPEEVFSHKHIVRAKQSHIADPIGEPVLLPWQETCYEMPRQADQGNAKDAVVGCSWSVDKVEINSSDVL